MVHGALYDNHLIQLKVVTGTLNAQKYQDGIQESGVRSPLDSLDGQNMVLQDDIARPHCTRIIEEYNNQQNVANLPLLICFKLRTGRIKTIVNFARLYCMSRTGFHVFNACTQ